MLKEQEFYDYIQEDDAHDPRTTRAAFNRIEADWNAGYDGIAEPLPVLGERIAALGRIDVNARTAEAQAALERLTAERRAATAELERLLAGLPVMQAFYRLRAERPDRTKAAALQQAQLALVTGAVRAEAADDPCGVDGRPLVGINAPTAGRAVAVDPGCRWGHPYYWAPFILMGNWL